MFKRLVYDEWMDALPIVAFVLTFGVFVFVVYKALRMRKDEADRMAHLPVEQTKPNAPTKK